jgi:hypothetical protein
MNLVGLIALSAVGIDNPFFYINGHGVYINGHGVYINWHGIYIKLKRDWILYKRVLPKRDH